MFDREKKIKSEEHSIDGWLKKFDFNDKFYLGMGTVLRRQARYNAIMPASKMESIELLGYQDGDIFLTIKTKKEKFDEIIKELVKAGYLEPDFSDKISHIFRTAIPNIDYLTSLLNCLSKIEPSVNNIAPDIINSAKPYSKNEASIPGWVKSGHFTSEYSSGGSLNRMETYNSTDSLAPVKKIQLLGYHNDSVRCSLKFNKSEMPTITSALKEHGFIKSHDFDTMESFEIVDIKNKASLDKLLEILSTIQPSIHTISDNIKTSYSDVNNQHNVAPIDDSESDDEIDFDFPFMPNSNLNFYNDRQLLSLQLLMAQLELLNLMELIGNLPKQQASVAKNNSTLFSVPKPSTDDMSKDISDIEMANSSFGQISNTARNLQK